MNIGHRTLLKRCAAIACAALVFAHSAAFAEGDKTVEFDIDAQELGDALTEFGIQSGREVYFVSAEVADIQTEGLEGVFTTTDAINRLLDHSGVDYVVDDNGTLLVGTAYAADAGRGGDSGLGNPPTASNLVLMAQNQTSQSSDTSNDDDERLSVVLEEILVTGSRIRGAQSASPVVTITRQDIERGGFATVEEIVEKLPQNFGAGATSELNTTSASTAVGGDVGDFVAGTSVNLRGLGASSTLVLFNGRRMSPSGRTASFTDISGIPVSAIERVEVLTDGASAIYGSDAIGGVINFIMRDDYEGAETRLRYGSDGVGDTSETVFAQSLGNSWDSGRALFSYEYYQHDSLANIDRDFAASNDLTRFGGDDFRTDGGNPANIRVTLPDGSRQFFAIPTGQDGTSLTSGDFDPAAPLNRFDSRSEGDTLPEQERHSIFMSLSQSIGIAEFFADVRFSSLDTESKARQATVDIDVLGDDPATPEIEGNPFFVDPTGTGLTSVRVDNYSPFNDLGPSVHNGKNDSYSTALGVRFDMGDNWNGVLDGNWSKEEASLFIANRLVDDALVAAVNQTDPSLAFNPFGDGSHTNPAVLDALREPRTGIVRSENELWSLSANVDGNLFSVPGGQAKLAAGVDFREESLATLNAAAGTISGFQTAINKSRDVTAVYAELFLPLVSADNSRLGMQRLELSLAARYEDYSDFGDSTNPKVGIAWSPTQALILRGTWGTSFRAPELNDLNTDTGTNRWGFLPQFFVDLGIGIDTTALVLQGANGDLQPEEATTWTVGFAWSPESIKGLSLDMTYFNVDFENRIDTPYESLIDGFLPRFSSLLTRNPGTGLEPEWLARVAEIVNDVNYLNPAFGIPTPTEDLLSGAVVVGAIMDKRINNVSKSVVTGVELQFSYNIETALGLFDFGLNGNYLFDFERALLATDPLNEEVDTLGRPVDFRGRGNVTWSRNAWSVSGFVNYTDSYTDNQSAPARSVDSWTTVDLTVVYNTGNRQGFFADTRMSLTAQNLLNEDPPFVNNFSGLSYDVVNANALGRFLAFQVTKEW